MSSTPRIYLDNAATSWPKPEVVYEAVDFYQRTVGAPGGRSGYAEAMQANRLIEKSRKGIARLLHCDHARQIVFTASGTDSLNLAIQGILRPGDHVVTTVCEHNSVLRPLRAWKETADVSVSYVPCNGQGLVCPEELQRALRPETRLVAVVHGSNVTGALQPVAEIGRIVRRHHAFLLVDAAQSVGHVAIDVEAMGIDLLAAPGHKGLLGPLGTGMLYIRPGLEKELRPLRLGGTGTRSNEDRQPEQLPDKYEAGNHNLLGLAGLAAALEWLESQGVAAVYSRHQQLTRQLIEGFQELPKTTVVGPPANDSRTSVVSIAVEGYDPQELAAGLDVSFGVQCRAGLHCAPRMHAALGSDRHGGLTRFSPGWATTAEEIERTLEAVAALVAG
ncbi:MAG: aminotransferase class V-fold PLP-dependent enzyme [Pirellulales bacterium]|nr:aminotransferase class V-fold PLP-dependent enzyme [Pirellulales bacterium]